ncbi:MAG: hypothetical protein ACK2UV_02610, partial [Candidatus Promineifilaceae bacterium]
ANSPYADLLEVGLGTAVGTSSWLSLQIFKIGHVLVTAGMYLAPAFLELCYNRLSELRQER